MSSVTSVRRYLTERAIRIGRGKDGLTGTSHASTSASCFHSRSSRSAWTACPPRISSVGATKATFNLRMRTAELQTIRPRSNTAVYGQHAEGCGDDGSFAAFATMCLRTKLSKKQIHRQRCRFSERFRSSAKLMCKPDNMAELCL